MRLLDDILIAAGAGLIGWYCHAAIVRKRLEGWWWEQNQLPGTDAVVWQIRDFIHREPNGAAQGVAGVVLLVIGIGLALFAGAKQ